MRSLTHYHCSFWEMSTSGSCSACFGQLWNFWRKALADQSPVSSCYSNLGCGLTLASSGTLCWCLWLPWICCAWPGAWWLHSWHWGSCWQDLQSSIRFGWSWVTCRDNWERSAAEVAPRRGSNSSRKTYWSCHYLDYLLICCDLSLTEMKWRSLCLGCPCSHLRSCSLCEVRSYHSSDWLNVGHFLCWYPWWEGEK